MSTVYAGAEGGRAPRVLAIMGSGELAPTMVSVHRRLVSLLPRRRRVVLLDTPFGFQENCDQLSRRAVEHFATSVDVELTVAGLPRLSDTHVPADPARVEAGLRLIDDADYLFAGPGSPTYALRQWRNSRVAEVVRTKLRDGGIVVFASAAAVTLGRAAVPVYEIYKVGDDVSVLPGLDLLSEIGIDAVVVPHYDNAEGAGHDTRFCYLGETRLRLLESMLDPGTWILGVDEHTALVCDLAADSATVMGNGTVTLRTGDSERIIPAGETVPLGVLRDPWDTDASEDARSRSRGGAPAATGTTSGATGTTTGATGLADVTVRLQDDFRRAISARDAEAATRIALELEGALDSWSADTLQGPDMGRARAALRAMISELGEIAAVGIGDPRETVGPYVEALLRIRDAARSEKRWDTADAIRDLFNDLGVEVRDSSDGTVWLLAGEGT